VKSSPNIVKDDQIKRMGWTGYTQHMGEMKSTYKIFVGKSEWKKLFGICRYRWRIILKWVRNRI
jgi:hypothetical protein